MDLSLYHLFLYATIILTVITLLGTIYYMKDRKRRLSESSSHMEMTPVERITDIDGQITALKKRIDILEEERRKILSRNPPG